MRYAAGNGCYHYEWKTDKAWARTDVLQLLQKHEGCSYHKQR